MSLGRFLARGEKAWARLGRLLDGAPRGRRPARDREPITADELPRLFRRVCQDLALARHRQYGAQLRERLNRLALRAHTEMYRTGRGAWRRVVDFAVAGFPQLVRANGWLALWSCLLLFGPGSLLAVAIQSWPELAYTVLDGQALEQVESMYDPAADHVTQDRPADSDLLMFGVYVQNNIGIAFRTYAGGLLYGLGTLFFLLYNSLVLGAVVGHVSGAGGATPLWSFLIGHGAFELTGIAVAGVAGLKLGLALVSPGRCSRGQAVRAAGRDSVRIVAGAGVMLTLAAFVEAFWSPRATIPPAVKYQVGGALWTLVVLYFALAGRGRRGP